MRKPWPIRCTTSKSWKSIDFQRFPRQFIGIFHFFDVVDFELDYSLEGGHLVDASLDASLVSSVVRKAVSMFADPNCTRPPSVLTVAQIRQVDAVAVRDFGMNSLVLMENAGRGCADFIDAGLSRSSGIVVLCGPGNNGGDGLVIARHLHAMGHQISLWMIADLEKLSKDAETNLRIVEQTEIRISWIGEGLSTPEMEQARRQLQSDCGSHVVVVDALLGTGATGKPRALMADVLRQVNAAKRLQRVAIDIPTGLDAETGKPSDPTFQADTTLTFVAKKPGFAESSAAAFLGEVRVLPIGVPPEVFDRI